MKRKATDKKTKNSKSSTRECEPSASTKSGGEVLKKPSKNLNVVNQNPPPIVWLQRTVKLSQLKPFERNPRRISKDAFEQLLKSLQEDGYHQRIIATNDLRIVGGHQRIRALKKIGLKEIDVLVPDRELSDIEFRRILIRDNLPFGEFDMDILSADYERDELVAIGMPEAWLPGSPDFEPEGEDEQGKLDEMDEVEPQLIHCPACKHEFSIMTEKKKK